MRTIKNFVLLALLALTMAGCRTSITNLSPAQVIRNTNGLYSFEAAFATTEQAIVTNTITAYVVAGLDLYPMQRTPVVKNRWEAMVPIPADKKILHYRYKFDYEYLTIPKRRLNSKLSAPYSLKIRER
jgi:hypothetical protein